MMGIRENGMVDGNQNWLCLGGSHQFCKGSKIATANDAP